MQKKTGPYIGVTGFMNHFEVEEVLQSLSSVGLYRRVMVGVLASSKTLDGKRNKFLGRYPERRDLGNIFIDNSQVLNLVHYNTNRTDSLCEQLTEVTNLVGPYIDGFQLNIAWPPVSELEKYHDKNPDMCIVLQIGARAARKVKLTNSTFINRIAEYVPFIDAILFDMSGGMGRSLDAVLGAKYLRAITDNYPNVGIGIAGGLGPDTLCLLDSLIPEFPHVSIDAEGLLRNRLSDSLCIDRARTYIELSARLFQKS